MLLRHVGKCAKYAVNDEQRARFRRNENEILKVKENLRERQTRILELWSRRKVQLDICQDVALLLVSADKVGAQLGCEQERPKCLDLHLDSDGWRGFHCVASSGLS